MKPVIAIVSLYDAQKESYWMLPGYALAIAQAGGAPVILPPTPDGVLIRQFATQFDGFLFPGGQDLSPKLYPGEHEDYCGELCPQRDDMEPALFLEVLSQRKPVLGICRGIQMMNVALGGTLYQDIPKEYPSLLEHHETPPYDKVAHKVTLVHGTPLSHAVEAEEMGVNSYHHQAVRQLGRNLQSAAMSPDGLVEAVYHTEQSFCLGVQWHPEFSYLVDENSRKLFQAFVQATIPRG